MKEQPPGYIAYLLRLWQTSDHGRQVWRVSLESPGTGKRQGFASLQELFDYLQEQTHAPECHDHDPAGPERP